MPDQEGRMSEQGAQPSGSNAFQGRYVMLNRWQGEVACDEPRRGIWGGPPSGGEPPPIAATNTAFVDRSATLGSYLTEDLPELGVEAGASDSDDGSGGGTTAGRSTAGPTQGGGCASCSVGSGPLSFGGAALMALLGLALYARRRR